MNYNPHTMLSNFLDSIKGGIREKLAGNTDLQGDELNRSAEVTADSFKDGITEKASQGQFDDIFQLAQPGGESSGFAGELISKTVNNLASKVGLPTNVATRVAEFAIPFVIRKFRDKTYGEGKNTNEGIREFLGSAVSGSVKDKLGGLGKKFGL